MTEDASGEQIVVVTTTIDSAAAAHDIADALVGENLAACVQIMPITSVYRWEGRVEHAAEHLLQIKTIAARLPRVEGCIRTRHTYDVPEILVVPASGGSTAYLAWIRDSVTAAPSSHQ